MPIYDNPATRRREGWHNGKVLWWIGNELISAKTSEGLIEKWGTYPPPPPDIPQPAEYSAEDSPDRS